MGGGVVAWIVCAVLVVVIGVVVPLWRRRRRRDAEALRLAVLEHEAREQGLLDEHARALHGTRAAHEREQAGLQSRIELAERAAAETRDLLRTGMQWEEASQHVLADVCRDVGLTGALITNVVFVPVETTRERKFVAQIDHLIVCESGALIVESKKWKGLVFDGIIPSEVHPSLGGLVDESGLQAPFALQVKNDTVVPRDGETRVWWQVSCRAGSVSPRKQVQLQGRRIHDLARHELGFAPWFDTCVFYSHPDATVHVGSPDMSTKRTSVVRNRAELRAVVRSLVSRPPSELTPTRVESLVGMLGDRGAHVEWFGPGARERSDRLRSSGR
jgi:hypothetical protein